VPAAVNGAQFPNGKQTGYEWMRASFDAAREISFGGAAFLPVIAGAI